MLAAVAGVVLGIVATYATTRWLSTRAQSSDRQSTLHEMGQEVMPFNLGQTTHIFEMTDTGGIQEVIADDPDDAAQAQLIQQHLQHEVALFRSGDFSDPTSLHGTEMPGVKELAAGVQNIEMEYVELPDGAQITFITSDLKLITALHRWFGAQLSDHGSDATYR
ncbi:MAG: hypothetical protein A2139_00925 [Desulfobacca sp. RBG_16_60_12]|nr:MAG: hypothetical protein A2139_00925 [Desulfobacca sp. RBG_16_60_12]